MRAAVTNSRQNRAIVDSSERVKVQRHEDGSLIVPLTPVEAIGLMRRDSDLPGGSVRAGGTDSGSTGGIEADLPEELCTCAGGVGDGGGAGGTEADLPKESCTCTGGVGDGGSAGSTEANLPKESAHIDGAEDGSAEVKASAST